MMVRKQIYLREEQAKAIKGIAAAQGLSMAEVIRRAVNQVVISSSSYDWKERRQRARQVAGRFRSGKRNISKDHDQYLSKAYC